MQMALEKCCLVARVPSLTDYVEDDQTAVLYEAKNSRELADKMQQLLRDGAYRDRIAAAGAKHLRDSVNEKIMAAEIEESFKTFLG